VRARGRPVGADSAVTRQRIVRAGREVLNERGYSGMTFQAIAKRTGLSRPTLHYYFSSREEIYAGIVEEARVVVEDCMTTSLQHDTLFDRLSAFVTAVQEADARDKSIIAFLISARMEPQRNPELIGMSTSPVPTFLDRLITDAVQRGELDAGTEPAAIADMLHVILYGMAFYAGFADGSTSTAAITKQLTRLFAHGLVPRARADRGDTPCDDAEPAVH
jgi:AcrR family transcriptional regulator